MWNEHFGISVAEYLATGLITIAHKSGGPYLGIVLPVDEQPSGFMATTEEECAMAMWDAWQVAQDASQVTAWRDRARTAVRGHFDEAQFVRQWRELVSTFVNNNSNSGRR